MLKSGTMSHCWDVSNPRGPVPNWDFSGNRPVRTGPRGLLTSQQWDIVPLLSIF